LLDALIVFVAEHATQSYAAAYSMKLPNYKRWRQSVDHTMQIVDMAATGVVLKV
jgi:hypothetical protein